jgi:hypothetical protein
MDENTLEQTLPDMAVIANNGHRTEHGRAEQSPYALAENGTTAVTAAGNGLTQQAGNGAATHPAASLEGVNSPALFWNSPLDAHDELSWFVPPLPHNASADAQADQMLGQFGGMMENQPRRAWLLRWNYKTRSAAAAAEQAHVEDEAQVQVARIKAQAEREITRIDADMARLNTQRQDLEKELLTAQNAFAEFAARAGLHCEVTMPAPVVSPARIRRRRNDDEDSEQDQTHSDAALPSAPIGRINPQVVEDALHNSVPTLQEMAGEYGVGPVGHADMLSKILSFFMQFLAPLVAGMMLALCLGTLVGILDIDTLQRSDSAPQLVLSAALGFVIVYLMGELFHTAVATLARSLETRDPNLADKPDVPRFRSNMGIAVVLLVVALGLGAAEVTAEGLGIRQLHQQQIAKQNRFKGTTTTPATTTGAARNNAPATSATRPETEELPLIVYLIIGTLISGPYLGYKTAKGWGENESHLREAWLTHRQRVWLDERRAQPDVQQSFHHAYNVEQIESNLTRTRLQLYNLEDERTRALNVELPPNMQTRRREARAAAVGEAARLQQSLEELVDAHEPMPRPNKVTPSVTTNRWLPDNGARTNGNGRRGN